MVNVFGSNGMVTVCVFTHPFSSVIVAVYDPAATFVILKVYPLPVGLLGVAPVIPPDQLM